MTDAEEHLPDLARPPLAELDFVPGVALVFGPRRPAKGRDVRRQGASAVQHDAATQLLDLLLAREALHLHLVELAAAETRVGDPLRELPIRGQEQQPLGMEVEAADREEAVAQSIRDELHDGGPTLVVSHRGQHPFGLVEEQVALPLRGPDPLAVELHRIDLEVGLVAERRDPPVHGDPPLEDQLLDLPAGGDSRAGHQLLQALGAHSDSSSDGASPPSSSTSTV